MRIVLISIATFLLNDRIQISSGVLKRIRYNLGEYGR
jgi:hypothetical protein